MIKRLAKSPIKALLSQSLFRRSLAFELKQNYFADLDIVVPLGWTVQCPVTRSEHWCSFEEIFFKGEYEQAMASIPLPARWLDLGCHAGYFSLWLYRQHCKHKDALEPNIQALLIDGDRRVSTSIERIIGLNNLEKKFKFLQGIIYGGSGEKLFAMRNHMSSAVISDKDTVLSPSSMSAQVITEKSILEELPGPYDLVKVDIEGGEYEFLSHYKEVLAQAKYLILEWHDWHSGGGGAMQIKNLAEEQGFKLILGGLTDQDCGLFTFVRQTV